MTPNKVCPVVLRGFGANQEILAFEHPLAGCQLIKGSIDHHESVGTAALRELAEESGIERAMISRELGLWTSGYDGQVWEARVTYIQGNPGEIHELARYEIRPESLDECIAAMHEFVAYIRDNEAGTLRYEVWQEAEHPTRFVHLFVWKGEEANRTHGESAAVKKFAGILYPNCLAPVEFIEYKQVDANAAFRRI